MAASQSSQAASSAQFTGMRQFSTGVSFSCSFRLVATCPLVAAVEHSERPARGRSTRSRHSTSEVSKGRFPRAFRLLKQSKVYYRSSAVLCAALPTQGRTCHVGQPLASFILQVALDRSRLLRVSAPRVARPSVRPSVCVRWWWPIDFVKRSNIVIIVASGHSVTLLLPSRPLAFPTTRLSTRNAQSRRSSTFSTRSRSVTFDFASRRTHHHRPDPAPAALTSSLS